MRLLLAAYCCSPGEGSEPWAGWALAQLAARDHDVTVLVEERKFRPAIESHLAAHPEDGRNLRFVFVPEKWWAHAAWEIGAGYWSYRLWQRRALAVAQTLHEAQPFDAVQASTIISFREPGRWDRLNIPHIWGPIGGTANVPPAMLPVCGHGAWKERLRSLANTMQLRSGRVRRALQRADVVVAATDETRRDLLASCPRAIDVVSEIVVPDVIGKVTPSSRDDAQPLRILFSGLHIPRKALPLLLDALAQTTQPFALRVLGSGPCEAEWRSHAERLNLTDRIEWAGWVDRHEVAAQYAWADLFAFASVRDTTGTVLLEALGAGVPVVGLDHQGVADVVTEACGITVPCTTPTETAAALAAAIDALAADRDRLAALALGARERSDAYRSEAKRTQWRPIWRRAEALATQVPADVTGLSPIKATLRRWKGTAAAKGAAIAARVRPIREAAAVGVINYHRIGPRSPHGGPDLNVTPEAFRRQIAGLLDAGWQGVTVSQVCDAADRDEPLPRKTFALTFDDAFASVHRWALPILRELGVPATAYLATRHVGSGQPFPFDPWFGKGEIGKGSAASDVDPLLWRPIDAAECGDLLDAGWELGAHTATHRDFSRVGDEFAADLGESVDWLAREFGIVRPTFSYPYGLVDDWLAGVVAASGCRCGLTTESRLIRPGDDPFWWGRFGAEDNESAGMLLGKLSGWFEAARGCWRGATRQPTARRIATKPITAQRAAELAETESTFVCLAGERADDLAEVSA